MLDFGAEPHDLELGANPEWDTTSLRLSYQSLTTPASVYDVDVVTGERTLRKQTPTPGVDLDRYVSTRTWATAPDGTRVPVDVVRHVDTPVDAPAPAVVYGYGSYEASMPPWFSVARLSLLDRGVVWALVHPRGGGELGRQWYLDGKLLHKRNTFTDTLAAVEHLVAEGWADPARVAIRGGSAGGLLVGACITMRPELFASAVAEVPFVDVVTTMSDATLPLTANEWEEWGDPRVEPYASYMLGYSPYDNTAPATYPALYVTAGLNDPRVSYHEPAKWVARLRAVGAGRERLLVLRTEMGAGHGGPSGRYDAWRDEARTLTFLLHALTDAARPTHRPVRADRRGHRVRRSRRGWRRRSGRRCAARWTSLSGRVDHAPKQAHGGCRPSTSWRAMTTLNATSRAIAASAGSGMAMPVTQRRPEHQLDAGHDGGDGLRGAHLAGLGDPRRAGCQLGRPGDHEHRARARWRRSGRPGPRRQPAPSSTTRPSRAANTSTPMSLPQPVAAAARRSSMSSSWLGIVVEQRQPPGADLAGQPHRVLDGAVAPRRTSWRTRPACTGRRGSAGRRPGTGPTRRRRCAPRRSAAGGR